MTKTFLSTMGHNATVEMYKDVARTYARSNSPQELAKKYDTKVSRISAIAMNLRTLGVNIPKMKKAGIYIATVDQLRNEDPELFQAEAKIVKRGRPAKQ